jgi:hypothetical protein
MGQDADGTAGQSESPRYVPTDFRITTYWKRRRNEPGLTQMSSRRIMVSEALDWVLAELPPEAVTVESDDTGGNVTIRICWDLVPPEIRYARRSA